ncbi:M56 family metallopeptidase [Amycolatopsis magusensis]|uniref:M56 family metallopeptidase n=1 Tax=Amycolatopsis magusensis TaxID=882444 RepID=UPI003C2AD88E
MSAVAHLAVTLVLCLLAVPPLLGARWSSESPGAAVVAWQSLLVTGVLCVLGLLAALGLAPYDRPMLPALDAFTADLATGLPPEMTAARLAWLVAAVVTAALVPITVAVSTVGVLRVRRRQRDLLALLGREDPAAPGAVVVDHPAPMAYCVPGLRPRIVVSSGTLAMLDAGQLAAVLGHERAHARERHDLVLVPFTALRRVLPNSRYAKEVSATVALLLEMRADDKACRAHTRGCLHAALRRFRDGGFTTPAGTLGIDGDITARLDRIAEPRRRRLLPARWIALTATSALASTPISLFVWPG